MDLTPMEKLQQVYKNMDLSPLVEPEQIERFRVDYGRTTLVRLKREIEAAEQDGKFIFSGHRGCGKSTLLKRLSLELADRYHVVFFSVADLLELSAVSHTNILYAIALQLLSTASKLKLKIPPDVTQTVLGWLNTESQIHGQERTQGIAVETQLPLVTLKLQQERAFRDELETTFARRTSELVSKIDRLAAVIQTQTKERKPVLVIIDDLDKLDLPLAEEVYRNNIKSLFSPAIRIVFTIPVSAIQEPAVMGALNSAGVVRPYSFPVAKFFPRDQRHTPDATPNETMLGLLLEMLKRRMPADLLDEETARQIVLKSGGVLRELVRLGRECCTECMVNLEIDPDRPVKIDGEVLRVAIRNLRNDFARQVGGNLSEILGQVYREGEPEDSADPGFVKLLHGLMVLEYENDALWYDVHPIVVELLQQRGLI